MKTCPICLQKIKFKKTLPCSHKYCNECIKEWLRKNNNCPVCRRNPIHRYNTRLNNFNKNKKTILNNIKGLINSDGCKLILAIFIHLVAPYISVPRKGTTIKNKRLKKNIG